MDTLIHWKGIRYNSNETCRLSKQGHRIEANGDVTGVFQKQPYHFKYHIKGHQHGAPFYCEISGAVDESLFLTVLEKNADGSWMKNGALQENLQGCDDIDISLTPFTALFPINRLQHQDETVLKTEVVYIDILSGLVKPVVQQYTCINSHHFRLNDFASGIEAVLTADENGVVLNYPGYFQVRSVE